MRGHRHRVGPEIFQVRQTTRLATMWKPGNLITPRARRGWGRIKRWFEGRTRRQEEVDALYRVLYQLVHDWDEALVLPGLQTQQAFAKQWTDLPSGYYLLSDPWFRSNVARILSEEEIQIKREWFRGKDILDAGCGNGRWAFGFAELGANVTAVDVNEEATEATRNALASFPVRKAFYVTPLESLSQHLGGQQYDLVFCWGVLHHCRSATRALAELIRHVKHGGLLYLYLYGRETMSLEEDLELFKLRLRFNLMSPEAKHRFLYERAGGDEQLVHNLHDLYAPLINRRVEWAEIRRRLESAGLTQVTRTKQDTEVFVRAVNGSATEYEEKWFLPPRQPPYWFHHHW